ncbi:MAG: TOBE domain-containing protein, partial [Actinobacteria bacterium]|nr:TOBE domain-containing protein [Actinomycetota bacterium]
NAGRLEQVGSPRELYERPATAFVAGFVGVANLFDEETSLRLFGRRAVHTLRPERVRVLPAGSSEGHVARVVDSQYLGAEIRLTCRLDAGGNVVASVPSTQSRIASRDQVVVWGANEKSRCTSSSAARCRHARSVRRGRRQRSNARRTRGWRRCSKSRRLGWVCRGWIH